MFAVIKTGGKQYSVASGDQITVMTLPGAAGDRVTFADVLMLSREGGIEVGAPFLSGASVAGEIVAQTRGPKVIAFKKRRRKNSKRKRGHRQDLTVVRIGDFSLSGTTLARPSGEHAEASAPVVPAEPAPEAAAV